MSFGTVDHDFKSRSIEKSDDFGRLDETIAEGAAAAGDVKMHDRGQHEINLG
jgi:hypothetical protein